MTATAQRALTLSCVILTMGDRPAEVTRAIDSVLNQRGAPVELVVVGNGADVTGLPAGVRAVRLPENVGVAAGRNAGVQACSGDVVLFLDDDALAPRAQGLALARQLASALRAHRIIQAVELSVLILAAAIVDAATGSLTATRALTVAALAVGALMTVAHLVAIVASRRLRS